MFLDDFNWLNGDDAIAKIVKHLGTFPAMYTDCIVTQNGVKIKSYLPAFSQASILSGASNVNQSIVVRSDVISARPFDERLNSLYFLMLIRFLASRSLVLHLPDFVFATAENGAHINADVAILNRNE